MTTRTLLAALAAAAVLAVAATAQASGRLDTCLEAISAAEERHDIPSGLLQAIAEIESDLNPLALNVAGRTRVPQSYDQAVALLYDRAGRPRRDLNIGCMQIHTGWHLQAVDGQPQLFLDPEVNVDYGASLLRTLYEREGSWREAVGWYHTSPAYPNFYRYICAVDRELRESGADVHLGC